VQHRDADGFAIPHSRMDEPIQSTLVSLAIVRDGLPVRRHRSASRRAWSSA
jgi:mannitol/fructose-specific phosphotransferase system IIA component (Ntr-type)